ncbi:MAG: hypothetical protein WA906_01935 [Pacificimonas sp.]
MSTVWLMGAIMAVAAPASVDDAVQQATASPQISIGLVEALRQMDDRCWAIDGQGVRLTEADLRSRETVAAIECIVKDDSSPLI